MEHHNQRHIWHQLLSGAVDGQIKNPKIVSDLLRVMLLFDHGGYYMDTDTITFKSLPEDVLNFCHVGNAQPLVPISYVEV